MSSGRTNSKKLLKAKTTKKVKIVKRKPKKVTNPKLDAAIQQAKNGEAEISLADYEWTNGDEEQLTELFTQVIIQNAVKSFR